MIATTLSINLGCASEFSPGDDGGVIEHAALVEILNEGAQGLVEVGEVLLRNLKVAAVPVPERVAERDDADTGFHQPTREQKLLVQTRCGVALFLVSAFAVALTDLRIFSRDVECVE